LEAARPVAQQKGKGFTIPRWFGSSCFAKSPKAIQAWAFICLTLVSNQFCVWCCDVTIFIVCGTFHFMLTNADICYQL
jgi:hypothetical protein